MCGVAASERRQGRVDTSKQGRDMGIAGMNGNPDRAQRLKRTARQRRERE